MIFILTEGSGRFVATVFTSLGGGGKSDKLKEVGYRTVSGIIELYQEE